MKIQKASIYLDDDYRNVMVKDFERDYDVIDMLIQPGDIVRLMDDVFRMSDRAEEYMYVIGMTTRCRPISFFEVGHGTCCTVWMEAREVLIRALLCGAASILLVHNHPSGDATPSESDVAWTKKMRDASDLIGITLCDHIIIGRDSYFSFREEFAKSCEEISKAKAEQ